MYAAEILDQLTHAEGLPKAALHAATAERAEMLPVFLQEIDSYLALEPTDRAKPTPLFFIFHLLGEWREKAAYRPLANLLRCREHELNAVLGDAITSTSHRVMAAVFDDDPKPLYDIILDQNAEQFVRSRMCETLAMLVLQGELDRTLVTGFLRDAYNEILPLTGCCVWRGWQSAIAMLGLSELTILVRRAFDRGYIDRSWIGFEHFQRNLEWATKHPGIPRHPQSDQFALFGNTVDELSRWDGFRKDIQTGQRDQCDDPDQILDQAYTNPFRGIGRNDLCPCGSGKKFKNCCLGR